MHQARFFFKKGANWAQPPGTTWTRVLRDWNSQPEKQTDEKKKKRNNRALSLTADLRAFASCERRRCSGIIWYSPQVSRHPFCHCPPPPARPLSLPLSLPLTLSRSRSPVDSLLPSAGNPPDRLPFPRISCAVGASGPWETLANQDSSLGLHPWNASPERDSA